MVLGVVSGLKNGELVMAGVFGGDCRETYIIKIGCTNKSYKKCNLP